MQGAGGSRGRVKLARAREGTGRNRARSEGSGPEIAVMRTVIRTGKMSHEWPEAPFVQ